MVAAIVDINREISFCFFSVEMHPYLPQNKLVEFCKQKGMNTFD